MRERACLSVCVSKYVFFSMQRHGRLPFMLVFVVCVCVCVNAWLCVCCGEIQPRAHGEFRSVANTYTTLRSRCYCCRRRCCHCCCCSSAYQCGAVFFFSHFCLPSDSCVPRMFPRLRSVLLTRQTLLLFWFPSFPYCLRGNLNGHISRTQISLKLFD